MGKSIADMGHLPAIGRAAQLLDQFVGLREAGCPQRVPLCEQPA